jgi:hypothetical protein
MAQAEKPKAKPKPKPKYTDKAQSERFIESARERGTGESSPDFSRTVTVIASYSTKKE